jgi:Holliday junction DNA helicase RuvA
MIGRLQGTLAIKKPPFLLIDVNGVGYEVLAPMSTFYQLPEVGAMVQVFTHFYVREEAQVLYGFYEEKERALFKTLIKISGVGPKMALTILSGMEVNKFIQCVESKDATLLVRLPGVGKKTAERLILEMAGKLAKQEAFEHDFSHKLFAVDAVNSEIKEAEEEAIGALISLGYKPPEASRAILNVSFEGASTQELIKRALQGLAKA